MAMTSQIYGAVSSSNFFEAVLFFLSSLVNGLSFMPISSLVLELWQFPFIRVDQKSGNRDSEFFLISGDWGKLRIANLTRRCLMKRYWMLQNARITALTVSELLSENHKRGLKLLPPPPCPSSIQIRVKNMF